MRAVRQRESFVIPHAWAHCRILNRQAMSRACSAFVIALLSNRTLKNGRILVI